MRRYLKLLGLAGGAALVAATSAMAWPTNVQLNTDADAAYEVQMIGEVDWQSSGDLVVRDLLPGQGSWASNLNGGAGGYTTSFSVWQQYAGFQLVPNPTPTPTQPFLIVPDSVTFEIFAHARLNDIEKNGGSIAPSDLDKNGTEGGDQGFEITVALHGFETATAAIGAPMLMFTSISGEYSYFLDQTPDSDVASGAGFLDGTEFLSGNLVAVGGSFTQNQGGNNLITSSVGWYDETIIAPMNTDLILDGTTFDTLVSLVTFGGDVGVDNGHEAHAGDVGDVIGLGPYTVTGAEIINTHTFKADANTEFSAVPEPGTMVLLGSGLLGLAGIGRRRMKA